MQNLGHKETSTSEDNVPQFSLTDDGYVSVMEFLNLLMGEVRAIWSVLTPE